MSTSLIKPGVAEVIPGVLKVHVKDVPWELFPEPSGRVFPPNQIISMAPGILGVNQPPGFTADVHSHSTDMVYLFSQGEMSMPGEGTYRAGDMRIVKANTVYGPETTGPNGVKFLLFSIGNEIGTKWIDGTSEHAYDKPSTDADVKPVSTINTGIIEVIPGIRKVHIADVPWERVPEPSGRVFPPSRMISRDPGILGVSQPPGFVCDIHSYTTDVVYFFTAGEMSTPGEGTYHAGDLRIVKANTFHGPETAGPKGVQLMLISIGDEFATNWVDDTSKDTHKNLGKRDHAGLQA
jgi:hypothetical protein